MNVPIVPGMQVMSLSSGSIGTVEKLIGDDVRLLVGRYRYITVKVREFWEKYKLMEERKK